jgi:hypothetical protein
VEPLAHVLKNLGSEACWICHGEGGMDEIVPSGTTWIAELKNGDIRQFEVTPESAGLSRSRFDDLKGGDAAQNAEALRAVLNGQAVSLCRCGPSHHGCRACRRRKGRDADLKASLPHGMPSVPVLPQRR